MDENKFCGVACTIVGTIGGVILAPAIGPLALTLPVLCGLFGHHMTKDKSEESANDSNEKLIVDDYSLNELIKSLKPKINSRQLDEYMTVDKHRYEEQSQIPEILKLPNLERPQINSEVVYGQIQSERKKRKKYAIRDVRRSSRLSGARGRPDCNK